MSRILAVLDAFVQPVENSPLKGPIKFSQLSFYGITLIIVRQYHSIPAAINTRTAESHPGTDKKMPAELFKSLDLDGDGYLSRSELTAAANRYGWSWREAPILAVLDLLSISGPIPERAFIAYIQQIRNDPMGPYGDVLRNSPLFPQPVPPKHNPVPTRKKKAAEDLKSKDSSGKAVVPPFHDITGPLAMKAGIDIANRYRSLLESLEAPRDFEEEFRPADHRPPAILYRRGLDAVHRQGRRKGRCPDTAGIPQLCSAFKPVLWTDGDYADALSLPRRKLWLG